MNGIVFGFEQDPMAAVLVLAQPGKKFLWKIAGWQSKLPNTKESLTCSSNPHFCGGEISIVCCLTLLLGPLWLNFHDFLFFDGGKPSYF
jgi:hypothetical protein